MVRGCVFLLALGLCAAIDSAKLAELQAELAAKMCSDCGHSLEEPEKHVAILVANMSFGGSTL